MNIYIEGVTLKLTAEQQAQIEAARKARDEKYSSFQRVLKQFDFEDLGDGAWFKKDMRWFAQINDHGGWHSCYVIGPGLRSQSGTVGGYLYESSWQLAAGLCKVTGITFNENISKICEGNGEV